MYLMRINIEKSRLNVVTTTRHIMPRACATTATTNMGVQRSHGTAHMRNSMLVACVRTATSTCTTRRSVRRQSSRTRETNLLFKGAHRS